MQTNNPTAKKRCVRVRVTANKWQRQQDIDVPFRGRPEPGLRYD